MSRCQSALDAVVATKAAAKEAVTAKDGKFDALEDSMKKAFRYAEDAVDDDDAKLARIGWSARHAPTPLAVPGQVRSLHVTAQGEGWLEMDWKKPADGGRVATYRIQRREAAPAPGRWWRSPWRPRPGLRIRRGDRCWSIAWWRRIRLAKGRRVIR
uniref:Fibronectin type III domain-containing protein n=1 Tax=Candidatus Kentrum sp. FW TaxID=2126338 RepID=A0A450U0D9_9GAMM|nr:MAG: hypothetical protein BECKFW1821C_GA0114237_10861 [Candidatus Kentron sp. FW]